MKNCDYKLRIANDSKALFYKPYNEQINQVVVYYTKTGNTRALVEFRLPNEYISQDMINELQIALNRAKRDCIEMKERFKEYEQIYYCSK